MRAPTWFKEQLALEGSRVLEREITDSDAAAAIVDQIFAKDQLFARRIVADYTTRQLRTWTNQHQIAMISADGPSVQYELFPEIPRRLEVAPGRFADQAVMNRQDWDNALRQAETKANNASGYAGSIRKAYDRVRPLFTNDEQTTADVWRPELAEASVR